MWSRAVGRRNCCCCCCWSVPAAAAAAAAAVGANDGVDVVTGSADHEVCCREHGEKLFCAKRRLSTTTTTTMQVQDSR